MLPSDGSGITKDGSYMFELFGSIKVDVGVKALLVDLIQKVLDAMMPSGPMQHKVNTQCNLSMFADLLKSK